MTKVFLHIDANCFFASCEELLNHQLKNEVFVVANHHIHAIISCPNKLARTYGIKAAMSIDEARKKYRDLIIVEPHFQWYEKKSQEMFKTIRNFLHTEIEIMSIDECFCEVSLILDKYHNNIQILSLELIKEIKLKTGLDVTIGAGDNKFLAKTASDTKPISKFAHLFKNEIKQKLWTLPIEKIYMVGKKTEQILKQLNIFYVIDFINYKNQEQLKQLLKKRYDYLINAFFANHDDEINDREITKSISQSTTLDSFTNHQEFLVDILKWLTKNLAQTLKLKHLYTSHLSIQLKYLNQDQKLITKSKSLNLKQYHNDEIWLLKQYKKLFFSFYDEQKVKLIAISANKLITEQELTNQDNIFNDHH